MTSDPVAMDAVELSAATRAFQISCREVMLTTLARIERTMWSAPVPRQVGGAWLWRVTLLLSLGALTCASHAGAVSLELQGRSQSLTLDGSVLTASAEAPQIESPMISRTKGPRVIAPCR
jgi:hypothetical protein